MRSKAAKEKMFTRFIYCYRWRATGVPVYVGTAWDVEYRDSCHKDNDEIPFDRLIAAHGRDAFTLATVGTVHGKTKMQAWRDAVPRENFWMDKLRTWHECATGGHNFMRADVNYNSDDHYKAARAAQRAGARKMVQDPKWQAAQLAARARPEYRASISAAAKAEMAKPGVKLKRRLATRAAMARPDVRARMMAGARAAAARKVRNSNSPAAIARRERIAQGLCGVDYCPNKRWVVKDRAYPECRKHILYFRSLR
jgi:hypothetical protein